jgi:phosphoglycolate phosphatase-like HAD superfamily hydrolase
MSPIQAVIFDVEGTLVDCVLLVMECAEADLHSVACACVSVLHSGTRVACTLIH